MMRHPRFHLSIQGLMEGIAVLFLALVIGRQAMWATLQARGPSIIGWVGVICLIVFVIPHFVLKFGLWLLPSLRADEDTPL